MGILHKLTPAELREARLRLPARPFLAELSENEGLARQGNADAVQRIRMMQRMCEAVLFSLPRNLTRKKPSSHTPANKLATLLFRKLVAIRKDRIRCSDPILSNGITTLVRYSRKTHAKWWGCAWAWASITTDVEVKTLIGEIGQRGSDNFAQTHLAKIKDTLMRAARLNPSVLVIRAHPEVRGWFERLDHAGVDYARRQTKKAAAKLWPRRRPYGPK